MYTLDPGPPLPAIATEIRAEGPRAVRPASFKESNFSSRSFFVSEIGFVKHVFP